MVWSQTNQVFKIKTMRFFGWSIWDAAAIGRFSCIQCRGKKVWIQRKSQNAQNECNTMRQSPSYTCGHVHGNRLCPTENKAIQSMRLCDVSCVFFYSRKWEKKANVLFSDFRVFFSSRWMSLYAHWLKNTRLTAQITMANDDRVDKKKTESVQHLFK